MSYDSLERSIQASRPVELYSISTALATYLLTSHDEDVPAGGLTYLATPLSRGNIGISPLGRVRTLMVTLPAGHPLVQVLLGNGFPPRDTRVTINRGHIGDSELHSVWDGYLQSIETDGQYARVHTRHVVDDAFNRVRLPTLKAQRSCNHMLYDKGCQVSSDPLAIIGELNGVPIAGDNPHYWTTTVVSVNGPVIEVASINGKADQYWRYGPFERAIDKEQRTITDHVGTTITVDYQFGTLNPGDTIVLRAGCDLTLATCLNKFNNVKNFGGMPQLPTSNPGSPTNVRGVLDQV